MSWHPCADGNRVTKTVGSDTTTYIYDVFDRLIEAKDGNNDTIFTATYDARTRRVTKTEGAATKMFRYDGGTNFQEVTPGVPETNEDPAVPPEVLTELVRAGGLGGGIGSALYSDDVQSTDPDSVEFFVYNAIGHTVALSDYSSAVTQSTLYEAFGETVAQTGGSTNNRLRNTKERDASIGLDNDAMRYYEPATDRYIQRDLIGYGDGMNVYASVHSNPVNSVDPLGLEADPWHHLASKSVFDPAKNDSTLNKLGMKLEEGIGVHSKGYGWNLDRASHAELHSNDSGLGQRWEKEQAEWLTKQKESGIDTITKDMLDGHIQDMKSRTGLTSPEGAPLIGGKAESGWKGTTKYYDDLSKDGKLLIENATAPERLGKELASTVRSEATWGKFAERAATKGVKITAVAGAVMMAYGGYSEARADGAGVLPSVMVGGIEAVNPLPWSSVEIKNWMGEKATQARQWSERANEKNNDGSSHGLDFDPYDFANTHR